MLRLILFELCHKNYRGGGGNLTLPGSNRVNKTAGIIKEGNFQYSHPRVNLLHFINPLISLVNATIPHAKQLSGFVLVGLLPFILRYECIQVFCQGHNTGFGDGPVHPELVWAEFIQVGVKE